MVDNVSSTCLDEWCEDLALYHAKLKGYVESAEWDALATWLDKRQRWFETLSSLAIEESKKPALKLLLQRVVEQDEALVAVIQAKKSQSLAEQAAFEKGSKMLSAYRFVSNDDLV